MRPIDLLLLSVSRHHRPVSTPALAQINRRCAFQLPPAEMMADPTLRRAFYVANIAHDNQFRADKKRFITHPIEVAEIVRNLNFSTSLVCSALLHDTAEDTDLTIPMIELLFDSEIADIVKGCSKMSKLCDTPPMLDMYTMLEQMKTNWKIVVVKVADRLHNMRTIHTLDVKKRYRIAKQTDAIFVPLAHCLGLWNVKNELGDLSLLIMDSSRYATLSEYVRSNKLSKGDILDDVMRKLHSMADANNLNAHIYHRTKALHSIHKKMIANGFYSPSQLNDILAFRVILDDNDILGCYNFMTEIHNTWDRVPGTMKDHINHPKLNGYQSLHSCVLVGDTIIEIQIRTMTMHVIAEYGAAAHWRYKEPQLSSVVDQIQLESVRLGYSETFFPHSSWILINSVDRSGILAEFSLVIYQNVHRLVGVKSSTTNSIATFVYEVEVGDDDELVALKAHLYNITDVLNVNIV
jgi:(p)ppGpp synthase/HD superfamily hydrolase